MQSSSGQEIAARFPWRHRRRDAGDGGTDEPAKLIEMESVEFEAEAPAEENEPVETIEHEASLKRAPSKTTNP